jgi:hypothetical protein
MPTGSEKVGMTGKPRVVYIGRWWAVLSDAELAQYDAAVDNALSEECAKWLENDGTL